MPWDCDEPFLYFHNFTIYASQTVIEVDPNERNAREIVDTMRFQYNYL